MVIAIHYRKGGFTERWISYCDKNNIQYRLVNCFDSNIIDQLEDCDALLWHFHHNNYKDQLVAKNVLFSLQQSGKSIFPDINTAWHFDDKVAQKYLLESINAPLVKSYVFYDKKEALSWLSKTSFPKVFKLKGGAGSSNVLLIKSEQSCRKKIDKAFGKGFRQKNSYNAFRDDIYRFKKTKKIIHLAKGIARFFIQSKYSSEQHRDKGYIFFQDFIPNNTFDLRVIVVANKAFSIKRMVRENDFRASGSGNIIYAKSEIDIRCILIAFETSKKLNVQSMTYDFVFNEENSPQIVEISYGFPPDAYDKCEGYWDDKLNWKNETVDPSSWIIENCIQSIKSN